MTVLRGGPQTTFYHSMKVQKKINLLSIYLGIENRFSFFYLHFVLRFTNVLVLNSSKSKMVEDDYNLSIDLREANNFEDEDEDLKNHKFFPFDLSVFLSV